MSNDTTTHDKPKLGSGLIREQAQYWRERAAMCLDNTPKTEREYRNKAAALNATADAYDAMLAACEKMSELFDGERDMGQMDSADFKDNACAIISACSASDAALALAKPK